MYARIGELVCRSADKDDYQQIYDLLVDVVCTDSSRSIRDMQKNRLKLVIEHYAENLDCIVVTDNDVVVAAYLGKGNSVLHMVSNGGFASVILLLHVVLEALHDSNSPSVFKLIGEFSKSSYLERFCTEVKRDTYTLNKDARMAVDKAFKALGGTDE